MKKAAFLTPMVLLVLLSVTARMVQAHGQPVITVQPVVASAGAQVTVTGSEMEPGEIFFVTLEGLNGSVSLGKATVTGEGEEGGFEQSFSIPENTPPGSYFVRAATSQGEKAEADLTVTLPSNQASSGPATMQEASGEPHVIDRRKPLGEVIGASVTALVSGLLGVWLVAAREQKGAQNP